MVSRKGDALVHLGVRTKKSDALASPFPLTSVPALRSHLCVALSSDTVKSETMIPSRAEYFKQPAGRLLWPGLAGNYDPAGRGKRLYASMDGELQMTMAAYTVWVSLGKKGMEDRITETAVNKQMEEWRNSYPVSQEEEHNSGK